MVGLVSCGKIGNEIRRYYFLREWIGLRAFGHNKDVKAYFLLLLDYKKLQPLQYYKYCNIFQNYFRDKVNVCFLYNHLNKQKRVS